MIMDYADKEVQEVKEMFVTKMFVTISFLLQQVAKKYEESKKCLLRAVDCYKEIHSIFQARS